MAKLALISVFPAFLAVVLFSTTAGADTAPQLIAIKPGLMCSSAVALAKLTSPDGSSLSAQPTATLDEIKLKNEGGCIDIKIGERVEVVSRRRNTSIVTYDDNSGLGPRTFLIPNIDFSETASVPAPEVVTAASSDLAASTVPTNQAPGGSIGDEIFASPDLDPVSLAFAYYKLSNTQPDFDDYAQATPQYQAADSFDQQQVFAQQKAVLSDRFANLNLSSVTFTLRTSIGLSTYDATAGGFVVGWSDEYHLPISDPASRLIYWVELLNSNDFTLIPMQDEDAARVFSREHNLSTAPNSVTQVQYDVVVKLTSTPPPTAGGTVPIGATIVAARVYQGDSILYQFPTAPSPPSSAQTAHFADVEGFHLGMNFVEADKLASSRWAKKLKAPPSATMYVNGFTNDRSWFRCGTVTNYVLGLDDDYSQDQPGLQWDDFKDCLAIQTKQSDPNGRLIEVVSQQNLSIPRDQIVKALTEKYGDPNAGESIAASERDADLDWVLPDSKNDASLVSVAADILTADDSPDDTQLTVDLKPYVNPNAPTSAPSMPTKPQL